MNDDIRIDFVLLRIRPGEEFALYGDSYDGLVWLSDTEKPTEEEIMLAWPQIKRERQFQMLKEKRDELLSNSDWTQMPDANVDKVAWAEYRQKLRDLPENTEDPENPMWPVPPNA